MGTTTRRGATRRGEALAAQLAQDDLRAVAQELERLRHEVRYQRDAWSFVTECVTTVDEVDAETPVKAFPVAACGACSRYLGAAEQDVCARCGGAGAPLTYLEQLARQWQRGAPPILIVPKARRMRLSWLFVALNVWLAWSRPQANVFFISSKEEKSAELVERAKGIVARLPVERLGPVPVTMRNTPPEIRFTANGSKILGIAEGADQLRQYTATSILADELGTWEWPRAAYTAMRPTIDGGGRLTIVSSAYPGFFAELIGGTALG